MRITSELAETLAVIVDEGTMDAAATRLNITPSAVSQRVKALETALGTVALVRSKPARATPAGAAVVRLARQYMLLERDALRDGGVVEGDAPARVPLAINADSLATWVLPALAPLARGGRIVFDLHRDDQDFTTGLLEAGTVMGAVSSASRAVAGCRVTPLARMRYLPVAHPDFAARWFAGGIGTAALTAAPRIDFDRRDGLQRRWLTARGIDPHDTPVHYVPASADFASATVLGYGWSLLPSVQAAPLLAAGALAPLGGDHVDVQLWWHQWNLNSPLLDAVSDALVGGAVRAFGTH